MAYSYVLIKTWQYLSDCQLQCWSSVHLIYDVLIDGIIHVQPRMPSEHMMLFFFIKKLMW